MNILFINSSKNWGGNENWAKLICESLSFNNNVHLAYRSDVIGDKINIKNKLKINFRHEADLSTYLRLFSFLKKKKIEIIISTKRKEHFIAGVLSRILGIKHVIRLGIVRKLKSTIKNKLIYKFLADGIIVNANQIKEVLRKSEFLKDQNIEVIYNGVNTEIVDNLISDSKFSEDVFRIISIGTLIKRKRMDLVIKSFAHFIKQNNIKNAELLILGDGEEKINLGKIVDNHNISEFIKFTGYLENPYGYLKSSDIFILCSENEGISNAVLEAMYLKKVVVSTSAGGVDYAIDNGQNGFLINNNIQAISDLFLTLYKDSDLRKDLGENAHKTIMTKFSLESMKENVEQFLFSLN